MINKPALALVILAFLIISCKKDVKHEEAAPEISAEQVFLIVEQIISGQILNAGLSEPYGLAASRDGSVFVVDRGANRVIRFNSDLKPENQIGGYGLGMESFNRPTFVAVDNELNIYISDENNRRVARFDARLNYVDDIRFADEEDPFRFGYPSGIGVTSYGEVWIADREKNRLCRFNNIGRFDRFLGDFGSPEGQLANPEKIVTDIDGKFYVCDADHRRLVIYDEFGNFIRKLVFSDIDYLIAAAIEKNAIWILDGSMSRILFADKNGKVLEQFGPILSGDNTALKQPSDLILLRDGRLLISDSGNRRILVCRIVRGGSE